VIDEAHNFIRNVYSNINSKIGKRAQVIYEYIIREKKENKNTKIILISGTPGINTPFELSLMFNMLRPGILPSSELEFSKAFITDSKYPILNPMKRNMFERRIMGLVSYYIGATPDLYAKRELYYVNLQMSQYQYGIYRIFEKLEQEIMARAKRYGRSSQLYRTYTRQACNFVFPYVNININGELRPRPGKFKIAEKYADYISKGQDDKVKDPHLKDILSRYLQTLDKFITETEKHFERINEEDIKNGHTLASDLEEFKKNYSTLYKKKFKKFYKLSVTDGAKRSRLFDEMYQCSPKMTCIVFMTYISPGKVMVYSNYVVMEGIDMLKVYYRLAGYKQYQQPDQKEYFSYCEYHGRIDPKDRTKAKTYYNSMDNIYGQKCKVIMISPSGTEGINLTNVRQEHIMEPYWTEVRIEQIIGRGIRQCSHKDLPLDERTVSVYRYRVIKPKVLDEDDTTRTTTDEYIEDQAKAKDNLIQSFLSAMKESAVDCELFRSHNMMSQSYSCFKFPEDAIMGKNVGPAYREDIKEDVKYDIGLNAKNSRIERIKVIAIKAVYQTNTDIDKPIYSPPEKYWYYSKNGMVYDYQTHYPVGKVPLTNGLPLKLDKDTYIMTDIIDIPTIEIPFSEMPAI